MLTQEEIVFTTLGNQVAANIRVILLIGRSTLKVLKIFCTIQVYEWMYHPDIQLQHPYQDTLFFQA